jgi:septal ring factor EnvC (AmiA/AmiB activator)
MSEEPTLPLPEDDTKRILALLQLLNERVERLEIRSYDTKPIWENALKEIVDTRMELREFREAVETRLRQQSEAFDAKLRETRESLETTFRESLDAALRRVERKIDVLNQNISEVRTDIRELDVRVEKLE